MTLSLTISAFLFFGGFIGCISDVPDQFNPTQPIYLTARITMYAPFDNQSGMCNDGDPSTTSTGVRPSRSIAAVDPSRIPYGTRFKVDGLDTIFTAGDTGSALRSYDGIAIDLFAESYNEARRWGVQYRKVEIIGDG